MKINEKNLCMFATSPPVDLEGWLNKRGEINKSWQKRYFILKGNLLFYFEKKGDKEPLGVIIMEGCTIELAEDGEQYCFQIIFHGLNNRSYFLSAESQELMEQWMKALTCAGYEYMKLMVAELQRQLEEIEGSKARTPENSPIAPKPPPRRQNPFNKPAPPVPIQTNQLMLNGSDAFMVTSPANITAVNNQTTTLVTTATSSHNNTTDYANLMIDTPILIKNNDFKFDNVHDAFGNDILKDLQKYREMENNNIIAVDPLIKL